MVIEPGEGSTQYVVRGLLSATQVGKQLGAAPEFQGSVSTFAELEETLNGSHALV